MTNQPSDNLEKYKALVALKFQLYNSLFTALPFHTIEKTGILLSLLLNNCEEGYARSMSPARIMENFFTNYVKYDEEEKRMDLLFRLIQFIERQVVLFDALEDAAFSEVHDTSGAGTLKHLELEVLQEHKEKALAEKLATFSVRLILTAHPTQFYPDSVLAIINDLSRSLAENNAEEVNMYLQQLGKTAFLKKQKPTPFDEAASLIWYLENVFYPAAGNIITSIKNAFPDAVKEENPLIKMGFWPGGDRDGNPFVKVDTTLKVAEALRSGIIRCYYIEIKKLKRRLTFKGVDTILNEIEKNLYNEIFISGTQNSSITAKIILSLHLARQIIIEQHDGLFLSLINSLINKVEIFGLHFATLDIRQNSAVHTSVLEKIISENYKELDAEGKIRLLVNAKEITLDAQQADALVDDTIKTMQAIKIIQEKNGEAGCNRYIISHCNSAMNVMEVYGLFLFSGWKKEWMPVDIVPLFETIKDLQAAAAIMKTLYTNKTYQQHLQQRNNQQTIMLGFSDGSKDGGYLMGNWSIYKAKGELTAMSKENNIDVIFFDGRGGPPARGGGKTNRFYASMGKNISQKGIQLTVQGQTVSSNFGTVASAQYNLEELVHAGISNELFSEKNITFLPNEESLIQELAEISLTSYSSLKDHPMFFDYLSEASPLKFYAEANIGSRPSNRTGKLNLDDLRAIPFIASWSQLKQNVTGYFGVGTALMEIEKRNKFAALQALYHSSLFFRTLIDNCEMSMLKCYFPLTEFLSNDIKFGEIWNKIYDEFELTKKYVLLLSGKPALMSEYPIDQLSISMRERIVLPLVTIQQFAITQLRKMEAGLADKTTQSKYEKMVIRASFGIINAGRNSV
ncbi:MAG: phosphoenolpyruvate carboxylase [Ferruginibacter sp.]|nr:phosphoenolpyruvate carboxylase [Ferruginibacter sp.]